MAKKTTQTPSQKAAAKRHTKFKQTRVQTFGGKKTSFTKAEQKRIRAAGYSVEGYSKAAPNTGSGFSTISTNTGSSFPTNTKPASHPTNISSTSALVARDNAMYGNTFPSGSIGFSEAGKQQAASNRAARTVPAGSFNISKTGKQQAASNLAASRTVPAGSFNISKIVRNEGQTEAAPTGTLKGINFGQRLSDVFTKSPVTSSVGLSSNLGNVASSGGLNIGSSVDSGEAEGSKTGRTVVSTDRDKNINYDIGGIAKDIGLGSLDFLTGNRFDFDNLGRSGDDKTPTQKFETFKKSPLQQAIVSKQLGIDAKRLINEGGPAAESLMKNYISQIDASSAKGIRNPIARLLRDTAGKNQTDATAMAGRAISAFSVPDENFSDKPNALTKALKPLGLPQLSEENVQDIRHTFDTSVTKDTGIPGKGLTNIPYTQIFGLANRYTAGKIKDSVEESMNQLNMKNVPTLDDAVALGNQFVTNMGTEGTVTAKRMKELTEAYQKYGPGGGQAPTIPSVIKGVRSFRRGGGSTPQTRSSGGGGVADTPVSQVPEVPPTTEFVVPQIPVLDPQNLANIQAEAYQNTFRDLMAINPNYTPNFQMGIRRGNTRSNFSNTFNRRFFS